MVTRMGLALLSAVALRLLFSWVVAVVPLPYLAPALYANTWAPLVGGMVVFALLGWRSKPLSPHR